MVEHDLLRFAVYAALLPLLHLFDSEKGQRMHTPYLLYSLPLKEKPAALVYRERAISIEDD